MQLENDAVKWKIAQFGLALILILGASAGSIAQSGTQHSITISWTEAAPPAGMTISGFNVYRATVSGGPYTKLNSTLIVPLNYVDVTGVGGTRYFYVATAVASTGAESSFSTEVSAIFLANPAPPSGMNAVAN
jgi:hypothetical protein